MTIPTRKVGEISTQVRGVTYSKQDAADTALPGYLPVLRAGNIEEHGLTFDDLVYVPASKVSDKQRLRKNDVLIAASSGSIDVVGKAARALNDYDGGFGAFCKVLRPNGHVDPGYFAHYFKTPHYRRRISFLAAGANINNLRNEDLDDLEIPLPPLAEQKRIAGILDAADALRAKRREALAQLDSLLQATFLDLFGDPVTNPKGWEVVPLPALASTFVDGPFGSNLKSSHYVDNGVRVIRLQNIGVGEMLNDDLAYISEDYFAGFPRNHCRPGDIVIGSMGDPNLRACVIPKQLDRSLNKADCFLFRVNSMKANEHYVCALLNAPATVTQALQLVRGQTRGRISLGRLKELEVPVPPLKAQQHFASVKELSEVQKASQRAHLAELDTLFASLQSRAFRGEL